MLIHEGGFPTGGRNDCPGISGPIVDIVEKLDPAVRLVVSGHTHKAYVCSIDGRLVTSGDKFGSMVTEIGVTIDRTTRKIVEDARRQPRGAHRRDRPRRGTDGAGLGLREGGPAP